MKVFTEMRRWLTLHHVWSDGNFSVEYATAMNGRQMVQKSRSTNARLARSVLAALRILQSATTITMTDMLPTKPSKTMRPKTIANTSCTNSGVGVSVGEKPVTLVTIQALSLGVDPDFSILPLTCLQLTQRQSEV